MNLLYPLQSISAPEPVCPAQGHVPFGRSPALALPVRFQLETPYRLPAAGGTKALRLVAAASSQFSLGMIDEAEAELRLSDGLSMATNDRWLRAVLLARIHAVRGRWLEAAQTIAEHWPEVLKSVEAGCRPPPRLSTTPALLAHQVGLYELEREILEHTLRWRYFSFGPCQMACCASRQGKLARVLVWLRPEPSEVSLHAGLLVDPDLEPLWLWCESGQLGRHNRARLRRVLRSMRISADCGCAFEDLDIVSFREVPAAIAQHFVFLPTPLLYTPAQARGIGAEQAWRYLNGLSINALARLERLEKRMGLRAAG
jgi:hypothetical protein